MKLVGHKDEIIHLIPHTPFSVEYRHLLSYCEGKLLAKYDVDIGKLNQKDKPCWYFMVVFIYHVHLVLVKFLHNSFILTCSFMIVNVTIKMLISYFFFLSFS